MSCGRLNASWKISSSAVDGQSFLVIDGRNLHLLFSSSTNSRFIISQTNAFGIKKLFQQNLRERLQERPIPSLNPE